MDEIVKACLDNDFNAVINIFNLNTNLKISPEEGNVVIANAICHNDIEMLEILLKNKVVFTEEILDFLAMSGENIFFMLVKYIQKGNVDFVVEDRFDILFEMAESKSATYKMFEYILCSTHISPYLLNMRGGKYYHDIAKNGKDSVLPYLIKNHNLNIFEKDDLGNSVFDYAIKSGSVLLFNEVMTIY